MFVDAHLHSVRRKEDGISDSPGHAALKSQVLRLIIELPIHAHLEVSALHGIVGGGDVVEAEESGEEVAAAHEERGPLDPNSEVRVDIQVVADGGVLLTVKLVEYGVVAVGVVLGVVPDVHAHLETQLLFEDKGGVEGAELAGEQRHRDELLRGVLHGQVSVDGEVLRTHGDRNSQLQYLRHLLQLHGLVFAVEEDVPP